jgi:hypothetical protein
MSYYRNCYILTLVAEYGNGHPAQRQMDAAGIDYLAAGFDAITLILDVKTWEKLQPEAFVPFNDLLNRAVNALPVSITGL